MNEDRAVAFGLGPGPRWAQGVAVADGMGGASGGERASRLVVELLEDRLRDWQVQPDRLGPRLPAALRGHLTEVADGIHGRIAAAATEDTSLEGMGSTMTFLAVAKQWYFGIHVGDSRAYLIRQGRAARLTTDHAVAGGGLVQAMGLGQIEPEFVFGDVVPGDAFVVCSDGLTKHLADDAIAGLTAGRRHPRISVERLIQQANALGGVDNIAVGVVTVGGTRPSIPVLNAPGHSRLLVASMAVGVAGLLSATGAAFIAYNRSGTTWRPQLSATTASAPRDSAARPLPAPVTDAARTSRAPRSKGPPARPGPASTTPPLDAGSVSAPSAVLQREPPRRLPMAVGRVPEPAKASMKPVPVPSKNECRELELAVRQLRDSVKRQPQSGRQAAWIDSANALMATQRKKGCAKE